MCRGICCLIICFLFCPLSGSEIENTLKKIPNRDREKIECLFSYFVQYENLGFVLFKETKPACMISLPLSHKNVVLPHNIDNPMYLQRNLGKCWKTWSCYKYLFKHPKMLICEEYEHLNGGLYLQLFVINKKTAEVVLEKHRKDFVEVLGKDFTPQKFLTIVERKKRLRPLIYHDEKLLGLLLGFGREASTAFKELVRGVDGTPPPLRAGYRPKGCCITPVSFRGNPNSPEVQPLIEAYTEEILEIEQILKSDSFLTTTLESFCSMTKDENL